MTGPQPATAGAHVESLQRFSLGLLIAGLEGDRQRVLTLLEVAPPDVLPLELIGWLLGWVGAFARAHGLDASAARVLAEQLFTEEAVGG